MAGIIASVLAAAGDAGVQSINQEIQRRDQADRDATLAQQQKERDEAMAKLQTQKEMTILAFQKEARIAEYNQMREERAARINKASDDIAQAQANNIYTAHDNALAGDTGTGTPLTPAQKAVINQTAGDVAANKPATIASAFDEFKRDPETYIRAAIHTGDLDPSQVAHLFSQDKAIRRQEMAQQQGFDHDLEIQRKSQDFQRGEREKDRAVSAAAKAMDPAVIELNAQAIADGRLAPLSGSALRSPGASAIMARALQINPKLSATDYAVALKGGKDFGTGTIGSSVRSFSVALDHINTLQDAVRALNSGDVRLINKLGNTLAQATGNPAPTDVDAVRHLVGDEISKSVLNGPGAVADRQKIASTLDLSASPAQWEGVINRYKQLMVGQLDGYRRQYRAATGKDDFDQKYLSDEGRALLDKLHPKEGAPTTATKVPSPFYPQKSRPSLDEIFGDAGAQPSSPTSRTLTYDPKTGGFH
ncbi:hypothetical protein [Duganella callida]|uniref:Uncharacterized protein n=1 Tax=Duganella callida TaxID=2561932 RepID=A0A4Y9RW18_9BURK|nr:hypothetical protein [Duganella callida]TFW13284.1 hypothetical protein E4L98_29220 [Duganella callida]